MTQAKEGTASWPQQMIRVSKKRCRRPTIWAGEGMIKPKSHHFVPRFYLLRFANAKGRVFVLDKTTWRSFHTSIENVACANHFYLLPELEEHGLDPTLMEQQFAGLESEVSPIIAERTE
jgi:hypothetical protein